jgi:hypothetical protein
MDEEQNDTPAATPAADGVQPVIVVTLDDLRRLQESVGAQERADVFARRLRHDPTIVYNRTEPSDS